jgi:hypothetical protein
LHLRLFAADPGQRFVYQHDKRTDKTLRRSIRKVAARTDYYTFTGPDGAPTDLLEQAFGQLETKVAPILRRFATLAPGPLTTTLDDRVHLGAYVALQYSRVPSHLARVQQIADFFGAVTADMHLSKDAEGYRRHMREHGATESDEVLDSERLQTLDQLRAGELEVRASPEARLSSIGQAVKSIGPIVAAMHWTLIRRTTRPWFVLGDAPVVLFKEDANPWTGYGFATEGVEVHMPISTTHAWVGTATDSPVAERVVDLANAEAANRMNAESWANAVEFVFGHSTDAIHAARLATPDVARGYREPIAVMEGGPSQWESYKPRRSESPAD